MRKGDAYNVMRAREEASHDTDCYIEFSFNTKLLYQQSCLVENELP